MIETAPIFIDSSAKLDSPLRVEPPLSVKMPRRVSKKSMNEIICQINFKPTDFSLLSGICGKDVVSRPINSQDVNLSKSVPDFFVLSSVSQIGPESGQNIHIAKAVTYDNQGNFDKAIESYLDYKSVCENLRDFVGIGIGLNSIGVDYMLMDFKQYSGTGYISPLYPGSRAHEANIATAIENHSKHAAMMDQAGKFTAHINLGLCYASIHSYDEAQDNFLLANSIASTSQNQLATAISNGNLAILTLQQYLASGNQNFAMLDDAIDRMNVFIQAMQSMFDAEGEIEGWMRLARITYFRYKSSVVDAESCPNLVVASLNNAMTLALKHKYLNVAQQVSCWIGLIRGAEFGFRESLVTDMQRALTFTSQSSNIEDNDDESV